MNRWSYSNDRTGDYFESLSQCVDYSIPGDTILYNGDPFVKMTSRNRLDFI